MANADTLTRRDRAVSILCGNSQMNLAELTAAHLAMGENLLRMLDTVKCTASKELEALWDAERTPENEEIATTNELLRQACNELMDQIKTNGQGVRF